ncbi:MULTISPECIES: sigma-70 family RNA polymerase sigma factor [Pseudomonas]|uniref:RNA polymerase sigma factor n=2 Tax=Pseudomonadaceae TaxID=135621 RepID=A0A0D0IYB7_9PSED|nr:MULTISPECIES: sigma-70 family RNA polymerase sigma factor [Pseudomonas]KIP88028.1 RNA polymerase sigma factor [Pseudomonas fulva]MCW2293055.1 RNA polymerase sigma-70 factor (ECF subfamily) [Pseudomonas sp. BIGb0408]NYH72375.1 RNA polymerase sigma-70 factor (ECF subfamily) [Pseudomonas flavescens]
MDNGAFASKQQFERLYIEHHRWLCSLLRRKLGNSVDAADLAHDTYLNLIRKGRVPSVEDSRCHLTQIAKGLVIDLYRRRHLEANHLEALMQQEESLVPSEETRALAAEALVQIEQALHDKPSKAREALLLCKLHGMCHRDIAAELKVSVSSVEKYIAAGLRACYPYVSTAGL